MLMFKPNRLLEKKSLQAFSNDESEQEKDALTSVA